MREIIVDQIMKQPVYSVDVEDTIADAIKKMNEKGTKKILVMEKGKPVGVLEKWKILESDMGKKVKDVELSNFKVVPLGTVLSALESDLLNYPAIYIFSPANPNKILGIITAFDLVRAY